MRNAGRSRMDASIRFLTNNFRRLKNSAPRVALPWRAASVGVQYADYANFFFYRASLIKKSVTDARLAASKGRVGAYNIVGVMFVPEVARGRQIRIYSFPVGATLKVARTLANTKGAVP